MAEITAALIKELRDRTDCGMMDAKRALQENGGDIEKAIEFLRKKGEVKQAKTAGRNTAEGRVGIAVAGGVAALVEVRCETDFTARNEQFVALTEGIAKSIAAAEGAPAELAFAGGKGKVSEQITALVAKTGENMQIGKHVRLKAPAPGFFGSYLHNDNKLGVLVVLGGSDGASDAEKALAKDLAMHAAANNPLGLVQADIPADLVAKEKEIAVELARQSGKPANIVEKIAEGRMQAFFKERTFLAQPFVKDPSVSVEQQVANVGKQVGKPLKLVAFARIKVGE
ncbi:MAG: translation elongation factor Ts [Planctomycetes bacterium]|jgi:elongation factor Ts|nr:translation elongation factor Ts [Planctomycetota bacterium]